MTCERLAFCYFELIKRSFTIHSRLLLFILVLAGVIAPMIPDVHANKKLEPHEALDTICVICAWLDSTVIYIARDSAHVESGPRREELVPISQSQFEQAFDWMISKEFDQITLFISDSSRFDSIRFAKE